jgi:hypothetical protein
MNPVTYLESKGWHNADNHITAKRVNDKWKVYFKSHEYIGKDTANRLCAELSPAYTVYHWGEKHAKPPSIIVCDINAPRDKKFRHTIDLLVEEKMDTKTDYICVDLQLWEYDDTLMEPTIYIQRYNANEELIHAQAYPIKHRLELLRSIMLWRNCPKVIEISLA